MRRRLMSRLGFTTNDEQAPSTMHKMNDDIAAATLEVYSRCKWAQTSREYLFSVGIDQRFVNYPTNCDAGGVMALGVWRTDEQQYRPLRRKAIPIRVDDEPLVAIGEPGSVNSRGTPYLYHPKKQLEIYPRPDMAYQMKMDYVINPAFTIDEDISVVDAECIVLWAMADYYEHQGETDLADGRRTRCLERIRLLGGDQFATRSFERGKYDRLMVAPRRWPNYTPDSGAWPSTVENNT